MFKRLCLTGESSLYCGGACKGIGTMGVGARKSVTRRGLGSRPRRWAVRRTDARTCWVCAPRALRLPPQTLRITTAGRIACSATPVGRVDRGVAEEREEGRCFARQMRDEALDGENGGSRPGEQVPRLCAQSAARAGEPVRGHRAGRMAIAQRERLLEPLLDAGGKRARGMIDLEQPRAAQQMRETRLMIGVHEAAVRRPAIAREYARKLLAENRGGIPTPTPTAGPNRVDRGVGGGERPEPVHRAGHFPTGFVGTHDRTATNLGTQRRVGRGGARRRAGTDMHQRPAGHTNAEAIAEQRHDVCERQTEPLMQHDDQGRRLRADLHRCRAERVRGLPRMPALHASAARRTRPHVDAELADDRTDHRQIFLILRHDVRAVHLAATGGTRAGQRRFVGLINPSGHGPCAVTTVPCPRSPARRTAGALAMRLGERRGLSEARPARRIELIRELLVPALQSIALVLGARQRIAQPSPSLPAVVGSAHRDRPAVAADAHRAHARYARRSKIVQVQNIGSSPLTRGNPGTR